jgi:hypothetical protein
MIPFARFVAVSGPLLATALTATVAAAQQPPLRSLDADDSPWRTARSGEGVRGTVFGDLHEIQPRDRRSVRAWTAGVASAPHADESAAWPFGSLYCWEHPDGRQLLRAVVAGVYNDVMLARPLGGDAAAAQGAEWVATLSSYTPPWSSGELIDGEIDDAEKVQWGYLRPGIGIGWRQSVGPEQDNMFASDLIVEPGLLYFGRTDRTAAAFQLPDSTFELRARWQTRLDLLQRNLLELPHRGCALGSDAVYGHRADADDWGLPGTEVHRGGDGRDSVQANAYALLVTDLPGVDSERWRLVASANVGAGDNTDRFSATRVGGGPDLRGEEWDTTARPLLPGAALGEFFPRRYAIASLGVRREVAFWAFVDVGGTVAWLDRDRERGALRVRVDDVLSAVHARLCSGFVGNTRLLLGCAYGFDVVRSGQRGGSEITLQFSGRF